MKGTITTNQRLANLEANKHRLISEKEKESKIIANAVAVFALDESRKGNDEFREMLHTWGEQSDKNRLRLIEAMEKANPSWYEDSKREIERRGY